MDYEEFILSMLVRHDIKYMSDCFAHSTNDLQSGDFARKIREEGYSRGYSADRIARERNAVINMMYQYRQRKERNVIHFEVEEHLPLGGFFEMLCQFENQHEEFKIEMMRVGGSRYLVLSSSNRKKIPPLTLYQLETKNYFSTLKGETPDPFVFFNDKQRLSIIINSLNLIGPSTVERIIDNTNKTDSDISEPSSIQIHDNPMSLLLHDYSYKLPKYVDWVEGCTFSSPVGGQPVDDLSHFIKTLVTYIDGSTIEEVEKKYPDWLLFCQNNILSVMMLDELVNVIWREKGIRRNQ